MIDYLKMPELEVYKRKVGFMLLIFAFVIVVTSIPVMPRHGYRNGTMNITFIYVTWLYWTLVTRFKATLLILINFKDLEY